MSSVILCHQSSYVITHQSSVILCHQSSPITHPISHQSSLISHPMSSISSHHGKICCRSPNLDPQTLDRKPQPPPLTLMPMPDPADTRHTHRVESATQCLAQLTFSSVDLTHVCGVLTTQSCFFRKAVVSILPSAGMLSTLVSTSIASICTHSAGPIQEVA